MRVSGSRRLIAAVFVQLQNRERVVRRYLAWSVNAQLHEMAHHDMLLLSEHDHGNSGTARRRYVASARSCRVAASSHQGAGRTRSGGAVGDACQSRSLERSFEWLLDKP